jgi:hypothetical protein
MAMTTPKRDCVASRTHMLMSSNWHIYRVSGLLRYRQKQSRAFRCLAALRIQAIKRPTCSKGRMRKL